MWPQLINLCNFGPGMGGISITYLLKDLFTTDLLAGAVNGTAAEPGPGTRAVVDTGSRVTISGDELKFASGGTYNDPVIHYGAITAAVGLAIGATIYQSINASAVANVDFGWDTDALTDLRGVRFNFDPASNIRAQNGNRFSLTLNVDIGDYAKLVAYQMVIIALDTVIAWCVKGGAYTNWTMLYKATLSLPATVFPAYCSYSRAMAVKELMVSVLPSPWNSDAVVASLNNGDIITGRAQAVLDAFFLV